jgi:hypothetical protein
MHENTIRIPHLHLPFANWDAVYNYNYRDSQDVHTHPHHRGKGQRNYHVKEPEVEVGEHRIFEEDMAP